MKPLSKCFVIMPFDEKFNWRYENLIKRAISDAGMLPVRADEHRGRSVIIRTIWNLIQNCEVCLADITLPNGNVYYEAGFADATRSPLITIFEEEAKLLFDLDGIASVGYSSDIFSQPEALENTICRISSTLKDARLNPKKYMPAVQNPILEPEITQMIISLYFAASRMALSDLIDEILREKIEGISHDQLSVQARFSDVIHLGRNDIRILQVKISGAYSDKAHAEIGKFKDLAEFLRAIILQDIRESTKKMYELLMSDHPPLEIRKEMLEAIKDIQNGQIEMIRACTTDMRMHDGRGRSAI